MTFSRCVQTSCDRADNVIQIMKVIDLGILALEHDSHTLSSAVSVLSYLRQQFSAPRNPHAESNLGRRLRERASTSLQQHLGGVFEAKGPAAMAALLDPRFGVRTLKTASFTDNAVRVTMAGLARWIADITLDEQPIDNAHMQGPRAAYLLQSVSLSSRKDQLVSKLNELAMFTDSPECASAYPAPGDISEKEVRCCAMMHTFKRTLLALHR